MTHRVMSRFCRGRHLARARAHTVVCARGMYIPWYVINIVGYGWSPKFGQRSWLYFDHTAVCLGWSFDQRYVRHTVVCFPGNILVFRGSYRGMCEARTLLGRVCDIPWYVLVLPWPYVHTVVCVDWSCWWLNYSRTEALPRMCALCGIFHSVPLRCHI